MRTAFLTAIVLAFTASVALADFTGKVVGVADGDTITVLRNGSEQVKVRFDGIDAPEKGQPFGDAAKKVTSAACFGKVVNVLEKDTDRYGRTIGVVEVRGQNLNLELVRPGHAWWYRQYAPTNTALAEAEKAATGARRGLWHDASPVPPWDWRKGEREPKATIAVDPSTLTHWLNNDSDKRHRKGCRYFGKGDGRPCTAEEGEACKVCGG